MTTSTWWCSSFAYECRPKITSSFEGTTFEKEIGFCIEIFKPLHPKPIMAKIKVESQTANLTPNN
jgi:hypothetical protein